MLKHVSFAMQVSSVVHESFSQVSKGVRSDSDTLVEQKGVDRTQRCFQCRPVALLVHPASIWHTCR